MKITDPKIKGKYLAKNALRTWKEDFTDEDTGEIVSVERNEIVARRGTFLDSLTISLLGENGIEDIEVSDECRLGTWINNFTKWEVTTNVPRLISGTFKCVTEIYLTFKSSAGEAETQIVDELEKSCSGKFKITGIKTSKVDKIMYSESGEDWFGAVIKYLNCDGKEEKMTILIRALNVDDASSALRNDSSLPNDFTLSEIKDTKFVDVYEPENQD